MFVFPPHPSLRFLPAGWLVRSYRGSSGLRAEGQAGSERPGLRFLLCSFPVTVMTKDMAEPCFFTIMEA
jgi:hypothetical protein